MASYSRCVSDQGRFEEEEKGKKKIQEQPASAFGLYSIWMSLVNGESCRLGPGRSLASARANRCGVLATVLSPVDNGSWCF